MDLASRGYDFVSGWSGIIKTLLNMYKLTNNEKFIYDAEHRINLMIEEIEAECNLYDRGKSNRMWAGLAHGLSGEMCIRDRMQFYQVWKTEQSVVAVFGLVHML